MFLTEAAFQLTIAAAGMAVMIHNTNNLVDDALAMGTGQYMANVASAVNTYVFDNMTVLAGSPSGPTTIAAGSVTATVANPLHPTVQDLINLKLLPIGFSDVSPLGLTFRVDLTPTNCSTGLTNCTIPGAMYSTTAYRDSAGRVRIDQLASVIATAGVDAGMSYAESPAVITGMAASWSAPNPLAGSQPGVLMMRVGNTSLLAQSMNQFYKRDGSLNLTGPMDANNQGMNRVGNFQSNGSVSAAGDVAAGSNVSGNGVYGNYMQSNGDLRAIANVSANGVYGNYVQSNGSAYVAGLISSGSQISAGGNVTSAGSVLSSGYLYAAGAVVPSTGGGQQVWEGWGCGDPQGAIRSDPNGKILSCQNGVWRNSSGGAGLVDFAFVTGCDANGNSGALYRFYFANGATKDLFAPNGGTCGSGGG
ncbi:adhesin, conjugal transfer protein PilV (plasmid) [Cupriavidus necator N-1]|uniref:Adhesin, conjugal transfer protein PilV n=1 Tax=Cupriavidus necator (strain ATCC 43291 / DSM 13513 / CCUG 52238 / LMG 8453 / N-1) TaxID=1042878 RepID=F8GY50_CUPNN|nr:adhesin [Cupriavidus necator]AEI83174.1 adhesin, conjugal transfer protein PilV [Cupriavidus necator N-1]MDX6008586.1 adhesin [Cupriavidus necator]